jgi:hypothetical protein
VKDLWNARNSILPHNINNTAIISRTKAKIIENRETYHEGFLGKLKNFWSVCPWVDLHPQGREGGK